MFCKELLQYKIIFIKQRIGTRMTRKYPLKRLGQNYLRDENIIRKIINEFSPKPHDLALEIGPGEGALTTQLTKVIPNLAAVELDKRNIELLRLKLPGLNLIEADFLKLDLASLVKKQQEKLRIVGNIPYNITSPIIFKMIENRKLINDSVIMVQNEVAQRITAKSGGKDYSILSVISQYFADVKLCFKVSPNVFYPRPKVYSAVLHFYFESKPINEKFDDIFVKIVKAAFGNRRKMLYNSFSNSIFSGINFNNSGVDLSLRAEKLSIENFETLAKLAFQQIEK